MDTHSSRTTVLTLRLDEPSMAYFEDLRQQHFPPALNRVPAHLSLFHQLPRNEEVHAVLAAAARDQAPCRMQVTGLRSLGRGVAFMLESEETQALHGRLARLFEASLIPQDRQGFRPHIVVQNKTSAAAARELLANLQAEFGPREVTATGLDWWEYLGGPWSLIHRFCFGAFEKAAPR